MLRRERMLLPRYHTAFFSSFQLHKKILFVLEQFFLSPVLRRIESLIPVLNLQWKCNGLSAVNLVLIFLDLQKYLSEFDMKSN